MASDAWSLIQRDFNVWIDQNTTGPEASAKFAKVAADIRDDVIAKDHPSAVQTWVDGRSEAPLETAKVPGIIRFDFSYNREIVANIFNMLIAASPYRAKKPGADVPVHYKDEHLIFVNGVLNDDITNIPADAEVIIVNVVPYARKIERGLSLEAPTGIYEMVAAKARRDFGAAARITFSWIGVTGVMATWASSKKSDAIGNSTRRKANKSDNRWPAITIAPMDR